MKIKLKRAENGFVYGKFEDLNGYKCSIGESSLATDDAIRLGVDMAGSETMVRMHLNREQVAALMPLLQKFVETGRLR